MTSLETCLIHWYCGVCIHKFKQIKSIISHASFTVHGMQLFESNHQGEQTLIDLNWWENISV